jgi:hypothetical protein
VTSVAVESPGDALVIDDRREPDRVRGWRFSELHRAGCTIDAASTLAARPDIDLHRACGLVERGCTPELALQILL